MTANIRANNRLREGTTEVKKVILIEHLLFIEWTRMAQQISAFTLDRRFERPLRLVLRAQVDRRTSRTMRPNLPPTRKMLE